MLFFVTHFNPLCRSSQMIVHQNWPGFTGEACFPNVQDVFKVGSVEFQGFQDVFSGLEFQVASVVVAVDGFTMSWYRPGSQLCVNRIVPGPSISHSKTFSVFPPLTEKYDAPLFPDLESV